MTIAPPPSLKTVGLAFVLAAASFIAGYGAKGEQLKQHEQRIEKLEASMLTQREYQNLVQSIGELKQELRDLRSELRQRK
jgi:septal ring factor EnvC (AmiA/AmiB activator)